MQRICVVGCSGAGKSTLSKSLAEKLGFPLIHLDKLWWQPGWVESNMDDFLIRLEAALAPDRWVVDGNFVDTIHKRLPRTDLVVWLDYPTWRCLLRAIWRVITQGGQVRSDMGAGCPERWDLSFLIFICRFRRDYRPRLLQSLQNWGGPVLRFTHPTHTQRWLDTQVPPGR